MWVGEGICFKSIFALEFAPSWTLAPPPFSFFKSPRRLPPGGKGGAGCLEGRGREQVAD